MIRPEAEQIASAVAIIRPDWQQSSLVSLLAKHQHRPARDVMLALVWVAYDPTTTSPGRISADGPWWCTARLAASTDPPLPPYYTNREPPPRDGPPAAPTTIRAIREGAKP
jgi:hypothetical protein